MSRFERRRPTLCPLGWLVCLVLFVSPAHAWGPHGHRIATRIAEARLSSQARREVRALLHPGDTLVDLCNWADHEGHEVAPGSASWHYVNVPISAPAYAARFCAGGNCVVDRIKHFRTVVGDRRAPLRERQRALLFLVHLVEDVHQPLHVGDNHDRGGNLTQVQFLGAATNLHRMWDSDLINRIDRNERDWVERLGARLTERDVAAWSKGTVEDWASESLRDARAAYEFPAGARRPLASGARLGRDYEEFARPILERRLAQAGVRLANELNAIFP